MSDKQTLSVIGGDLRQLYAADRLRKTGYDVRLTGFEHFDSVIKTAPEVPPDRAMEAEILLLPLPVTKNGRTLNAPYGKGEIPLQALLDGASKRQRIFLGNADARTLAAFEATGAEVFDYFTDESLTLFNALLTAEGLLGLIIEKLPCAVFGSQAAITGYGRIGGYLARLLRSAGAEVTVFARAPAARAKARTFGLHARDLAALRGESFRFDYLINTVPARILKRQELSHLNTGCFLFEAAGAPGGIDLESAQDLGFGLYKAASLPGRSAPKSAGCIIAETVRGRLTGVKI